MNTHEAMGKEEAQMEWQASVTLVDMGTSCLIRP